MLLIYSYTSIVIFLMYELNSRSMSLSAAKPATSRGSNKKTATGWAARTPMVSPMVLPHEARQDKPHKQMRGGGGGGGDGGGGGGGAGGGARSFFFLTYSRSYICRKTYILYWHTALTFLS